MERVVAALRRGREALARLSPREKGFVAAFVLVLLLAAAQQLAIRAGEARDQLAVATGDLVAARTGGNDAAQLSRQATAERRNIVAWSWSAPSVAVAPLVIERRLVGLADHAGLSSPQVSATAEPVVVGGVAFLRTEVSAGFDRAALARLLTDLDQRGEGFLIERFTAEAAPGGLRLRMALLIPLRVGE